jgi:inosine-uridine nucleoside N-ribohydrolase
MEAAEVRRRFAHEVLRPVLDLAEVWFQEEPLITFHDPLAAATLFDEEICGFESGTVVVEPNSETLAGFTQWQPGPGPHEVALRVDKERFFAHYFSILQ